MSTEVLIRSQAADLMFSDALSGKFEPPTDKNGESHTLLRLMLGTLDKGTQTSRILPTWQYGPSWAPVTSVVELQSGLHLCNMTIQSVGGSVLNISRNGSLEAVRLGISGTGPGFDVSERYVLEPGDFTSPRDDIASIAQSFFETVHDQQ